MLSTYLGFFGFTIFVIVFTTYKLRKDNFNTAKGYFLAGKKFNGSHYRGVNDFDQHFHRTFDRYERELVQKWYYRNCLGSHFGL